MAPEEFNDEDGAEELPQDGVYDEGLDVREPNAGNAVTGYDASKDQRLQID